eukprot:CAMPEP_0174970074 /NCGR_PEP_ID=MMETSP0004_2-20121128/9155_1 /TAXON_ID=420556 /ORGANISM="Ochromonas sp., Strain CCMP1393" /LENGTH=241 /DNA_ID=CAMNT_0016219713 /DNA_START=101 /DNA_END=823 /DNA_ORIENTATION=-
MGNASPGDQRSHSFDSGTIKVANKTSSKNFSNCDVRRMSPGNGKRKRFLSSDSVNDYGWFEDTESPSLANAMSGEFSHQPLQRALTLPAPATEPPMYILESSLETQQLWYSTAGRRPKQPQHEREYFEKLWSQNFEESEIHYPADENPVEKIPSTSSVQSLTQTTSTSACAKTEDQADVIFRGKSPFSHSVSKSFDSTKVSSMTLQIPYYRIVRDKNGHLYAEYLIVVSFGGRGAVTFGIW